MNRRAAGTLLVVALAAWAPSSCKKKDAPDIQRFSEDELWETAQSYLSREKYKKASEYFKLLLDQYPSGRRVREAHLAYADTLYLRGSDANLIEAQAKYLAYVSFYPEDEKAAYAQYRIGLCNYARRGEADRDQAVSRDAINELEKLIQNYPQSGHVDDAKARIRELRDELAEHEFLVARFYGRRGFERSVVRRLKFLLEKYPEHSAKDKVYLLLAETLAELQNHVEAIIYLEKLLAEYPRSELLKDARDLLEDSRRVSAVASSSEGAPVKEGGEGASAARSDGAGGP